MGAEIEIPDEAVKAAEEAFVAVLRTNYSMGEPEVAALKAAAPLIVAAELERTSKIYADSSDRALDAGDNVLAAHQLGVSIYLESRASELRGEAQ